MKRTIATAEFLVTLALLIVSVLFLFNSLQLPGGEFDPLGPGAAPEMVSSVLVFLCALVLTRTTMRTRSGNSASPESATAGEPAAERTPRQLLFFATLLVAYIVAFQLDSIHFILITTAFVFLATTALRGWEPRTALLSLIVALGISVFLFFALTHFFVIRLPGVY